MTTLGLTEAEILSDILAAAARISDGPAMPVDAFPVSLNYLLEANGAEFVRRAYLEIAGRGPTSLEEAPLIAALASGDLNKIEILGTLRDSPEGAAHAADIPGLRRRWQLQKLYKMRVIGRVLRVLSAILLLPRALRDLQRLEQAVTAERERLARLEQRLEQRLAALERGRI